jgi:hypothetical protein
LVGGWVNGGRPTHAGYSSRTWNSSQNDRRTEKEDRAGTIAVGVHLTVRDEAGDPLSSSDGLHVHAFRGDRVERMTTEK